ncbi:MAG: hypothetical protein PUG10_00795 [Lachnospiraceae bacterium]|nr:hypothetical protein [Lachnospiraceae bacterium]
MEKYKALLFRLWKLARGKYILSAFLYVLTAVFVFLPFLFEINDIAQEETIRDLHQVMNNANTIGFIEALDKFYYLLFPVFVGGATLFALVDFWKADIQAGWNKFAIALPASSSDNAITYIFMRLLLVFGFELITLGYGLIYGHFLEISFWKHCINIFNMEAAIFFLFEMIANYLKVVLKDKKQRKKAEVIIVLIVLILPNFIEKISVKGSIDFTGSNLFFVISIIALLTSSVISFMVMKKLYERRLP